MNNKHPFISTLGATNQVRTWLGDNTFPNGWNYFKKITIDHTKVGLGSETQSNFPVLISLTGLSNINSNGSDIRFTDVNGVLLPREIEYYSAGTLVAWVKVTSVSHTTDTVIYMYYGNTAATEPHPTDTYGSQNVWDSNFLQVSHLSETTGLNSKDSTSKSNTSFGVASPTQAAGKINGSLTFNGSTQYEKLNSSGALYVNPMTISLWLKTSSNGVYIYFDSGEIPNINFRPSIQIYTSTQLAAFVRDASGNQITVTGLGATITNNAWHRIDVVVNNKTIRTYTDGTENGNNTNASFSNPTMNHPLLNAAYYGAGLYDASLAGSYDEVRISNVERSAGWINTEYLNQNDPSTFYSVV